MSIAERQQKKVGYDPNRQWSKYDAELDAYMQKLYDQYGQTEYWKEFESNPYLNYSRDPQRADSSFWREMHDNYYRDAMVHINNVLTKIREEEYNQEINQVSRQQIAGLNPDLNGVANSQATEATELPQNALPSEMEWQQQRFNQGLAGASLGVNFIQSFMGLASDAVGLKNSMLQGTGLELSLIPQAQDIVTDTVAKSIRVPKQEEEQSLSEFMMNFRHALSEDNAKNFKLLPYSKKTRKFLSNIAGQIPNDSAYVAARGEDLFNKYVLNKTQRLKGMSSPLWSDDTDEMLAKISEGFSNIEYNNWKLEQEVNEKVNQFRLKYQDTALNLGNAEAQADLENVQINNAASYAQQLANRNVPENSANQEAANLELQRLQNEIETARKSAINDAEREFRQIQERYLRGDKWYHTLGRILLPAIRQFVTQSTNAYFSNLGSQLAGFAGVKPPAPLHNTYDTGGHFTTINNPAPNPYMQ